MCLATSDVFICLSIQEWSFVLASITLVYFYVL